MRHFYLHPGADGLYRKTEHYNQNQQNRQSCLEGKNQVQHIPNHQQLYKHAQAGPEEVFALSGFEQMGQSYAHQQQAIDGDQIPQAEVDNCRVHLDSLPPGVSLPGSPSLPAGSDDRNWRAESVVGLCNTWPAEPSSTTAPSNKSATRSAQRSAIRKS